MKKWLLFCFSLFAIALSAAEKKICLNMIVKDESKAIVRCLTSIKPYIDYWVIVDTGSSDGTQKIIKEFMSDVPGELHEQPWVNFGHNRNEALKLAKGKGDYVLFIDADEVFEGAIEKEEIDQDIYLATVRMSKEPLMVFLRALLINNHLHWSWKGVVHEAIQCEEKIRKEVTLDVVVSAEAKDGHRAQDPHKYLKDALVLEKALIDDPNNADYVYYLAQSYYNAKELELALKNYERRAKMEGRGEQTWWAKYHAAFLQELLGKESELIIKSYNDAFLYSPSHSEPIFRLANYFFSKKQPLIGYALAKFGQTIPIHGGSMYSEGWIHTYGMLAILANCAIELGKYQEAIDAYREIGKRKGVPETVREHAALVLLQLEEHLKNL
jgi:glycosyltransferase involved in cell wall biosynthesis